MVDMHEICIIACLMKLFKLVHSMMLLHSGFPTDYLFHLPCCRENVACVMFYMQIKSIRYLDILRQLHFKHVFNRVFSSAEFSWRLRLVVCMLHRIQSGIIYHWTKCFLKYHEQEKIQARSAYTVCLLCKWCQYTLLHSLLQKLCYDLKDVLQLWLSTPQHQWCNVILCCCCWVCIH